MKQNEPRTDLQKRIAQELQDRAKQKAKTFDQPDGVTDSAYLKHTRSTSSLAWLWLIVFIAAIAAVIWLLTLTF